MLHQPVTRRENQPTLLGRGNTGRRTTKARSPTTAHFNKHGHGAVTTDQIDFTAFDTEVALDDPQPLTRQIIGGERFTGIAA